MYMILMGVLIGVSGTMAMDAWSIFLYRVFSQPKPDWGFVGRWVGNLPRVFHDDIAKVAPVPMETALGWAFHYGIGVFYGALFAVVAGKAWFDNPSFVPIWIFGLLTISGGWFLLFPGMGLGWALAKLEDPWRERAMGLVAHTIFATGMWVSALLL